MTLVPGCSLELLAGRACESSSQVPEPKVSLYNLNNQLESGLKICDMATLHHVLAAGQDQALDPQIKRNIHLLIRCT